MKLSAIALASVLVLPAAAMAQGVTDAQIASIVVTANQVDIDAGNFAKTHAKDPQVKQFAQQMVTDHTGVNKQAGALVKKLGVKPEDNDTSRELLETLLGAQFDILTDRMQVALFYLSYIYIYPVKTPTALLFLFEFVVLDQFLSNQFARWPVLSPNYFYQVDRLTWRATSLRAKSFATRGDCDASSAAANAIRSPTEVTGTSRRSGQRASGSVRSAVDAFRRAWRRSAGRPVRANRRRASTPSADAGTALVSIGQVSRPRSKRDVKAAGLPPPAASAPRTGGDALRSRHAVLAEGSGARGAHRPRRGNLRRWTR